MFKPPLSTQVGRNARVKKLIWQRFVFAFFAAFLYILDHYLISHWDVKTLDSTPGSLIPGVDLMIHPTWPTPDRTCFEINQPVQPQPVLAVTLDSTRFQAAMEPLSLAIPTVSPWVVPTTGPPTTQRASHKRRKCQNL